MRRPYPVPVEQLQAEMRQWTDTALAQIYGVPIATMARWRTSFGIAASQGLRRRLRPGLQERLVDALAHAPGGLGYRTMARRLGCSWQNVAQGLKGLVRRGVVRRDPDTHLYRLIPQEQETP